MGTTKKQTKVTSLNQLKDYMNGAVVRLPDFAEGQEFYARLKRPSLLRMVQNGVIPNELLTKTNELFVNSDTLESDVDNEKLMSDMMQIFEVVADATMIEPTYQELKDNGVELTDQQLMFLFSYSQQGVNTVSNFRGE